ncbi:MAG: choice-of-anchor C family protein [Pyrinomonadaceae bacterium]|nr:choice-of-anchor C family protein [Phycisphaerales bacterium]
MFRTLPYTRFASLGASCLAILMAQAAFATDRLVPSQYPTIRAAVNAAVNGDHVIIANGTYTGPDNRDIDFGSKNIVVRSESGIPDRCVIDCQSAGRGFIVTGNQPRETMLSGLTIQNANAGFLPGGAMYVSSGMTITNCQFRNGRADKSAGVYVSNPDGLFPLIENCYFSGNRTRGGGAALGFENTGGVVSNCVFTDNACTEEVGGAVNLRSGWVQNVFLVNCLFLLNSAPSGGAMYLDYAAAARNCIAWGNGNDPVVVAFQGGIPLGSIRTSIIEGLPDAPNEFGNFGTWPLFVAPQYGDYHLQANSPAVNRGVNAGVAITDIDGYPRIHGGGLDIGPYEFQGDGPVPNDTCANATTIAVGTYSGTTFGASREGVDTCLSNSYGGDVWYRWTATCSSQLQLNTCGSTFDTVIGIYSGTCGSPTLLMCNDDAVPACSGNPFASGLVMPVTNGTTYLIRVGGYRYAAGNFTLNVALDAPPSNSCQAPIIITGADTPFSTVCENVEPLQSCIQGSSSPTTWFNYTAASDGTLSLSTCGATFDTTLACYRGSCNQRVLQECNDDTPCVSGNLSSFVSLPVLSGVTYIIRVGGSGGAFGSGLLHTEFLQAAGPLTNGSFEQGSLGSLPVGSTAIPRWVVTRGGIDCTNVWQAADGSRSVDLQGLNSSGGVQQTVTTTPGVQYRLTFALAGNPDNGPVIKHMTARAGAVSENYEFNTTGKTRQNMGWVDHSVLFVAASGTTELEFYSTDAPGSWGAVIDNIRLVEDSGDPCPADVNGSGSVTSQDFFDFIAAFFAGNADFNHDGETTSQDFFNFIAAFFTGC